MIEVVYRSVHDGIDLKWMDMVIRTKSDMADTVPKGAVMLLGYFDGFHIGHQALAEAAYQINKRKQAPCVMIWTFDHLAKGKAITDNEEKAEAFFSYSDEYNTFSGDGAEAKPCAVVCGFNFRFGKNGASGARELSGYCGSFGIECCVVPPHTVNGEVVSSSVIKQCIESGETLRAMELMGRPYSITAPVVHGKRIGHTLGFPTVNQRIPEGKVQPGFGIYACRIHLPDGGVKDGVCNIGSRPTVNGDTSDITLKRTFSTLTGIYTGK